LPATRVVFDSLSIDSLTTVALSRRPDILERAAAVRQATALATVARREAFPNLLLRGSWEPLEGGDGRTFRPGIGLTLPAFNRNQGDVQARRAEALQAELERVALVAETRAMVSRAVRAYRLAAAEVDVLERTVLTPARENRRLLEVAYRAGKVGLPVLLLIRNQVIDAESEYWDAWLSEREARVAISQATGENISAIKPQ
jgi:cobalt-zinc-cadmium efflux system outer membrane protein